MRTKYICFLHSFFACNSLLYARRENDSPGLRPYPIYILYPYGIRKVFTIGVRNDKIDNYEKREILVAF